VIATMEVQFLLNLIEIDAVLAFDQGHNKLYVFSVENLATTPRASMRIIGNSIG
jgi:hypothetical protein